MECQESIYNANRHWSSCYTKQKYVEGLEMGQLASLLQKTCVLGTAKIVMTLDT